MGGGGLPPFPPPPPPPLGIKPLPLPPYHIWKNQQKGTYNKQGSVKAVDREKSWFDEDVKVQKQEAFNWKPISLACKWAFIASGACYFVYKLMGDI